MEFDRRPTDPTPSETLRSGAGPHPNQPRYPDAAAAPWRSDADISPAVNHLHAVADAPPAVLPLRGSGWQGRHGTHSLFFLLRAESRKGRDVLRSARQAVGMRVHCGTRSAKSQYLG